MNYKITYYSDEVLMEILSLPDTIQSKYISLSGRMKDSGANLGLPHTKALGEGLFELRLKGAEGIARVFYCTLIDSQIMMLQSFVKKTQKIPLKELRIAKTRMNEVKNEH